MTDEERADALAAELIGSAETNGPEADRARAELAGVSHAISDLIAARLASEMDRDPHAVCAVFSNHVEPLWFESGIARMVYKLHDVQGRHPGLGAFIPLLKMFPVRRDALERAGLARRVASVYARAWVIGFVWLPALFALLLVAVLDDATARLAIAGAVALALALVLAIDARLRRCPSCRRWLAGMEVGMRHTGSHTEQITVQTPQGATQVDRTAHAYASQWRCVHCERRWEG